MEHIEDWGEVENVPYELKHIEWRIPDFFADQKNVVYNSSTFSAADDSWSLRYACCGESVWMGIFGKLTNDRELALGCSFGLRKCDGTVMELAHGIIKRNSNYMHCEHFIKKTELLQRKTELVPSDILTVTCTIKWMTGTSHSAQPNEFGKSKSLKLTRLDKLSKNFKDLYTDKETCDVTLKVKDKEYKAHKSILVARSNVFAATFKHDTLERQTGIITISDCDPDSFGEFLQYLYSGELEELSFQNAINLYYTSDKYDIEELKEFCVEQLKQCLTVENVSEIAMFADKYEETQLFSIVQDFFNEKSLNIFLTSQWKHLLKSDPNLVDRILTRMANMKLGK